MHEVSDGHTNDDRDRHDRARKDRGDDDVPATNNVVATKKVATPGKVAAGSGVAAKVMTSPAAPDVLSRRRSSKSRIGGTGRLFNGRRRSTVRKLSLLFSPRVR
jgi:hypothetical protein